MLNYWWVTRPKRKLNSVPDVLGVFAEEALGQVWAGERDNHLTLEQALEDSGLKRQGDRRDQTGGGGRTYRAWLKSLGLLFTQTGTKQLRLTLAGEAIMNGASPVKILTHQVLRYQFPSSFSVGRGVQVNGRFKIHPFWFLLKLLADKRVEYLTQEELARVVCVEAEDESDRCYEHIVTRVLEYRDKGVFCLQPDFCEVYKPSRGEVNPEHPYSHLDDLANTLMNWLEYTQLTYRNEGKMRIIPDRAADVADIIARPLPFIARPNDEEYFQRRYGLDPDHKKDTRNLNATETVTARMIAEHRVKQAFISCSLKEPIGGITPALVDELAEKTGILPELVREVLEKNFPHGSIGAFMTSYFEMAYKGTEECRDFEKATAKIFGSVFGLQSEWLGSAWSGKEVPDVLLTGAGGWQAIIDTKAYSKYELPTTHCDRMIHHYIPDLGRTYGEPGREKAFFAYIAGGFSNTIATPLQKIVDATGVHGAAVPVADFIRMIERQQTRPYSEDELRRIFTVDRKTELADLELEGALMVADGQPPYGK
ncbi:MAG: restriction endonuclease FokI C-terminal domain-containing protein [Selenomonadaceae bacterium]|nr:restriction endonuclease FokI C-terminal domain-containing protein [Selenomonadaceae bacterium]